MQSKEHQIQTRSHVYISRYIDIQRIVFFTNCAAGMYLQIFGVYCRLALILRLVGDRTVGSYDHVLLGIDMVDYYISIAVDVDVVALSAELVGLNFYRLILAAYIPVRSQISGAGDDIVVIALWVGPADIALGLDISLVFSNYLVYLGILEVDNIDVLTHGADGIGIGVNGFLLSAGIAADAVESQILGSEAGLAVIIGGVDVSYGIYPNLACSHGICLQSFIIQALQINSLKFRIVTALY